MSTKINLTLIVYGLALFSGISYLWGFWIKFDINILSYVALTEIVKASVYPALPAIGILAAYSAMDGVNSMSKKPHDEYMEAGGIFKGFTYLLKFYCVSMILFSLGSSAYTAMTETGYMRLRGLYPLLSLILFLYIIFSNKYLLKLPVNLRVFVVSIFCFLPTVSFDKGYANGEVAMDHKSLGYYVVSNGYCSSASEEKFRYIGVLGSRLFSLSSKDNSICISKSEDFKLISYNEPAPNKQLNKDVAKNAGPVN
ncbi:MULTISPECIES: hypothetical protein [unclassified Shewanella]|uniref:hypothetical protein n=1 Tax=unclassified Shewanella TaxID=196818 RepID=UPI001BBC85B9|nr:MULTISPECIES: hypothetical protein [unclassified Shewanella]GIU06982.1 hypothetical protein TUM4444_05750 [Shewanella sp. MBTL60-112-B1]GIU26095.1 hypothetical protein TUM4445_04910 [Shewanella sp. MBTL60-112-B2]